MDTSGKSGRAAATVGTLRLHLGQNGMYLRTRNQWRTWWHTWHGGALLVTWLVVEMLSLEQIVQAAPTVTSQTVEAQSDHRGADGRTLHRGTTEPAPNAEHKITQGISTAQRPSWSTAPILPLLPFSSQNASVHTAWAERAPSVRRAGRQKQGGLRTGYKQGGAEQILQELRDAGAEHEQELDELQVQCAQLNLDFSWVQKLVSRHLRRNSIPWTATTRAAVSTALKKIAELVNEIEHRQAADGTPLPTDLQRQRRRLTLQAQRLLEEHVAQPLRSFPLHDNMYGSIRTDEGATETAQATNYQSTPEQRDEKTKVKTAEAEHAKNLAIADASAGAIPVDSVEGLQNTADNGNLGGEHAGPGGKGLSGNAVDVEDVPLPLSETVDSLKQKKAVQPLLVLPLRREIGDAVAEDDGQTVSGEYAEEDVQTTVIQENESHPEDVETSQTESEPVEVLSGGEKNEETGDNTRRVTSSNASSAVDHFKHPVLHRPHHTVHFLTRTAAEDPEKRMMGLRRALTVGQLETLLQSRIQQRPRRSPSRPLIFPSCYFDAPMQKRMREKATVLAASLEQLNDAVEALTELGVVVEKQAELVEKAAFTLVYRDRLMGEPTSPTKAVKADDLEGDEKQSDTQAEQNVEEVEEALTPKGNKRSPTESFKTGPTESGGGTVEEKKLLASVSEPQQRAATDTAGPEEQAQSENLQIDESKYKKLVGANGVRKQLRELFASWELARRAAGASEMPNEIMRRAETLRRGFVLPLQQNLHQLNLLDATLSPNHVALQRLVGCKGFINAVRRTVSRAEEDLYNLGAHAFASEVSLPLMAHDLQNHVADLLEHVVQSQLQHHRALHMRAASLISLHREFFRSARELQQEATARLKDSHLLAMSAEEWHEVAQRLSVGVYQLRVDLARQLVALRSVDKKAARLEGILNLLQGGLEQLLHVEVQLQRIRKNNGIRHPWTVLEEEDKDEVRTQNDARVKPTDELTNGQVSSEKEDDTDVAGLKPRDARHSPEENVFPRLQARVIDVADEALSLELPPKVHGSSLGSVATDFVGEAAEQDEKAMKILQRLLAGVMQMAEFLQMYKQQSSDAEQLLRNRFHIVQESVQKVTGVAQTMMAQPLALDLQQQEQRLRDKIPSWARSIQRQGLNRGNAERLKDSAALVKQVNEKVRFLDATLFALEDPSLEENPFTGREVVARIDRINSRLFKTVQPKQGSRSASAAPFCAWHRKLPFAKKPPQKRQQGQ